MGMVMTLQESDGGLLERYRGQLRNPTCRSGRPIGEVDLLAYTDGQVVVAEAKRARDLGSP